MQKHFEILKVRISDAASGGHVKLPSLLAMMQEAATLHADSLGVGRTQLGPLALGWALAKFSMRIEALPVCGQSVKIYTWASNRTKILAGREFEVKDAESGRLLALARTQWVLMNLKTRRIERINSVKDWGTDLAEYPYEEDFGHLQKPEAAHFAANCTVRKEDIDINLHVNNAVYLTWALEALPLEFFIKRTPRALKLHFLAEVRAGESVRSECVFEGGQSLHSIYSAADGKECARANIDWT